MQLSFRGGWSGDFGHVTWVNPLLDLVLFKALELLSLPKLLRLTVVFWSGFLFDGASASALLLRQTFSCKIYLPIRPLPFVRNQSTSIAVAASTVSVQTLSALTFWFPQRHRCAWCSGWVGRCLQDMLCCHLEGIDPTLSPSETGLLLPQQTREVEKEGEEE